MTHTEDEAAITALVNEMYQAWDDHDADAFVRHYADDATAILPGSLRAGRETIRDSMAAGFAGPLQGTSPSDERVSLRFLGDDAAIAISRGGFRLPGEAAVPETRQINATWVFEKRDDRWMIAAYHNSPART